VWICKVLRFGETAKVIKYLKFYDYDAKRVINKLTFREKCQSFSGKVNLF